MGGLVVLSKMITQLLYPDKETFENWDYHLIA